MKIVTESISCLTEEDCRKLGVTMLPLFNISEGEVAPDFIGEFNVSENSFTLPPSELDYYRAFYEIIHGGEKVLCITLSRKLSQAYVNAIHSAMAFPKEEIAVIDSLTCAGGQFLMIVKARELESEGKNFDEIVSGLNEYRKKITLSFALDDFSTIRRAKRISTFSRGNFPILNQKPVFLIMEGGVNYAMSSGSMFRCIKEIVQGLGEPSRIVIHYSAKLEGQERELCENVRKKYPRTEILVRKVTASLLINIGEVICAVGDGSMPQGVQPNEHLL